MKRRAASLALVVVAISLPVLAQRRRPPALPSLPSAPASASASASAPVVAVSSAPEPDDAPPVEAAVAEPPKPPASFAVAMAKRDEPPPAPIGPPRGSLRYGAEVGWRTQRITSAGYDPFSSDDWHGFASVSGWYVPLVRGPWSLAATGGWDVGSAAAYARGQETSLTMHRIWAAPEGRLQLGDLGHVFARVGPSVWHMRAELVDGGVDAPLVRRPWRVGGDAAVGARARALELRDERGAWLIGYLGVELGYAFVPSVKMDMQPKHDAVTPRDVSGVRLPDLSASGYTVRLTVSSAF